MAHKNFKIKFDDEVVSGVVSAPDSLNANSKTGLIFAHGAGNDMNHPLLVSGCWPVKSKVILILSRIEHPVSSIYSLNGEGS